MTRSAWCRLGTWGPVSLPGQWRTATKSNKMPCGMASALPAGTAGPSDRTSGRLTPVRGRSDGPCGTGNSTHTHADPRACHAQKIPYCGPSRPISEASESTSAGSRSDNGGRTGPALWPTIVAPALTMLTA